MSNTESQLIQSFQQLLLGLEVLCPDALVVSRTRYLYQTLDEEPEKHQKLWDDVFAVLKAFSDYPITSFFQSLIFAKNEMEQMDAALKIVDHFSPSSIYEEFRLIISNMELKEQSGERLRALMIRFLKARSQGEYIDICDDVISLVSDPNVFFCIDRLLRVYYRIYDDERIELLRNAINHKHYFDCDIQFLQFLKESVEVDWITKFEALEKKYPSFSFVDAFSKGQLKSKLWALDILEQINLKKDMRSILILCGWYGTFSKMFMDRWGVDSFERIRSLDKDSLCMPIADQLNKEAMITNWLFKAVTGDIFNIEFDKSKEKVETKLEMQGKDGRQWDEWTPYDLIVNTSCEHIENFQEWYESLPDGQLLLLQSNNFFSCEGHVNCVASKEDFQKQTPMTQRLFAGSLPFDQYTRYMVIGYK